MATRLRAIFPNLHNEVFSVYIDDSDYSGDVVDVEVSSDGFSLSEEGDPSDPLHPVIGSRLSVSVIVTPDVESDVADFAAELRDAAEGRFTIRVDYNTGVPASPDVLYWVGYVLTDLSSFEDLLVYPFTVTATDGLGRLKGVEYKDDSGDSDAPWGDLTIQEHLLKCLNADALSALYYDTSSDVFLRTVVDWADDRIGAPTAAICPTTRTQFSGEIFAKRDTSNDGKGWKFQSCYDVLQHICTHYAARISFSLGCYRFEQINSRAQDIITERRFARDGTLVSSDDSVGYDKAITLAFAGFKIATILFDWLPALKKVTVDYDHDTYRNYLQGLSYKWYKDSGSNTPFTRTNIKFDADSYIRISGRINVALHVTTYTEPWRYIFGMELSVDAYKLRSFTDAVVDGSGNGINVIKREPVDWQISSVYYEISTDFQYSNIFSGYINFSAYTSIVPSGVDSFAVDFYPLQGEDNQNNNHAVVVDNWQVTDLVMNIVGIDNADNYESNRKYELNNPDTGNSKTLEIKELFGHPVKPWTPTKIQTSADGSTWEDTDATWAQGTETTNYEFGQLLAAEIMSLHRKPLQTLSGSINGNRIYYHSRLTTLDGKAWLPMSVRFVAKSGTWSGDWFQAGVDRFTGPIPIRRLAQSQAFPPGFAPGVFSPHLATLAPSSGQGNISLGALSTNHLSAGVNSGTVTSIDLEFPVGNNSYLAGDDIFIVNPATGEMIGLKVTATADEGDTTLSVSGTADVDFPVGAHIVYSALNKSVQGYQGNNLPSGTLGQILRYGAAGWEAYSGAADNHVLTWDPTNGWQSEAPPGGGGGTVTSVGLSLPTALFDVTGSPVTTTGTLTATLDNQSANQVFAGPTTGGAATPAFRALVAADIPNLDAAKITTGTFGIARGGTGLSALGTALQLLRVNAGATALEYFTPTYLTANQTITLSGDVTGSGTTAITATIANGAVTLAKMENRATQTFIGRNTAGTGIPEELSIVTAKTMLNLTGTNTGDQTITLTGDVTGSGTGSFAATIATNAVTDAKFRQSVGLSLVGRSANSTGNVADITAANDAEVLRRSGTSIGFGTVATGGLSNNAVTDAKFRQSAGLSVVGRAANSTGDVADITAGTDAHVLRRSGTSIGFGQVATGGITDAAVTYAKIQSVTDARLLGRSAGSAGAVQEITVGSGLSLSGGTLTATGGGVSGSGTAGRIAIWSGTTSLTDDSFPLFFDTTNNKLGVGTASPASYVHIAVPTGTNDEGLRIAGNLSGNLNTTISNANNASASANNIVNIVVGGASAGDPVIQLGISGAVTWSIGLDNSDSDKFKISAGSTPGSNDRLIIDSTGNVGIGTVVLTARMNIAGSGTTSATYSMLVNNNTATTILAVRDDQRVGILTTSPSQELHVNGDVIARQYMNTSAAPSVSFSTGAGTGPVNVSLVGGVNFFSFLFTTGTSPAANGDIFTITLNQPYPSTPIVIMAPGSVATITEFSKFYVSGAGTNVFTVKANGTLTASTTYFIYFHTGGY